MKSAWVLAALLWPFASQGISRVGNRTIGDSEDRFTAEAPSSFPIFEDAGDGKIRMRGSFGPMASGQVGLPFIEASRLITEFPEFQSLDRQALGDALASRKWWKRESGHPCLAEFLGETSSAVFAIAAWGPGRGVVMVGPNSGQTKQGLLDILNSIRLEPGACTWR